MQKLCCLATEEWDKGKWESISRNYLRLVNKNVGWCDPWSFCDTWSFQSICMSILYSESVSGYQSFVFVFSWVRWKGSCFWGHGATFEMNILFMVGRDNNVPSCMAKCFLGFDYMSSYVCSFNVQSTLRWKRDCRVDRSHDI